MAEVLCDFPELTTTINGKEVGIMKRRERRGILGARRRAIR